MLAQSMAGDGARLCVPVSTMTLSALAGMSTVWYELPDGAVSSVSGRVLLYAGRIHPRAWMMLEIKR